MKSRDEIIEELKGSWPTFTDFETGTQLGRDMNILVQYARLKQYIFSLDDALAIGYMAGQSALETLFDEEALRKAIDKYDETDPTNRFDTVAEVFIDLLDFKL